MSVQELIVSFTVMDAGTRGAEGAEGAAASVDNKSAVSSAVAKSLTSR